MRLGETKNIIQPREGEVNIGDPEDFDIIA